ncbi:unnamed protein product [Adineta steineri]|uniref:Carrier domain-containing protein n=1 Tax=Adineta steineri TaxID=433720 RepID=A0A816F0U2_9BILA|nr:unnamed protein product [Adineta steineri]CAF1654985.1 unnamed protein product [Adineta steineri]
MTNEHQLVHVLWCDMLQFVVNSKIPINRSFFSLGGNSLAIMRLFAQYQIKFSLDTKSSSSFNIASLFRQPTIAEHTQIFQQWLNHTSYQTQLWSTTGKKIYYFSIDIMYSLFDQFISLNEVKLTKRQHNVVITKDASVNLIYLGTRLHHYDCLLEGEVSLSNLFYKNSNNYIQKIIGQLISNSSSVLSQCQGDELTIVYGSVLIQQIFEQNSITLQ